jgi:hypothetical protein
MWQGMAGASIAGTMGEQSRWSTFQALVSATTAALAMSAKLSWDGMWNAIQSKTASASADVKTAWHGMLSSMQRNLNAYRPYLEYGWQLLKAKIASMPSVLSTAQSAWNTALSDMLTTVNAKVSPILSKIDSISSAWSSLMSKLGQPVTIPSIQMPKVEIPQTIKNVASTVKDYATKTFTVDNFKQSVSNAWNNMNKATSSPAHQAAMAAASAASGGGLIKTVGKTLLNKAKDLLTGFGLKGIPGFANGGIIGSESIVRVGERNKREAIIPLQNATAMRPFAQAVASEMGANGGGQSIVLQVGTLIGDERSFKELERRLRSIRIEEQTRGDNR